MRIFDLRYLVARRIEGVQPQQRNIIMRPKCGVHRWKHPKGVNGKNFRYRIKAKPLGWFGTETEQLDRFDRSITFFTQ
ncbi:MAG: hypothetical protein HC902_13550 [Calothrix sp. SM1_5_4]|nr:hypothetical protein [Calothrix sp. SM1_5_4]